MAWQNAAINEAKTIEDEARRDFYEQLISAGVPEREAREEADFQARIVSRDWLGASTQF